MIIQNSENTKALHLHVGGDEGLREANGVFHRLSKVCGDTVQHRRLTEMELSNRGYDINFVKQVKKYKNPGTGYLSFSKALEFPNDGYIPPYVDGMLEGMVRAAGGIVESGMRLKKILVIPFGKNNIDTKVSKAC